MSKFAGCVLLLLATSCSFGVVEHTVSWDEFVGAVENKRVSSVDYSPETRTYRGTVPCSHEEFVVVGPEMDSPIIGKIRDRDINLTIGHAISTRFDVFLTTALAVIWERFMPRSPKEST